MVNFIYGDSKGYVFLDGAVGQEDGLRNVGYMGLPVAGVVSSTFDEDPERHVLVADMVLEKAKTPATCWSPSWNVVDHPAAPHKD